MLTTTINKLRAVIQDFSSDGVYYDQYLNSAIFTLADKNIDASSVKVFINQVQKLTGWTFNSFTNKVTYTATLIAGDNVEIHYSYYKKYSDVELAGFIRAAIMYLSIEGYKVFICREDDIIFPQPDEREENLMVMISDILISGDIWRYRTPEINVEHFKTMSKLEKIQLIIRQAIKTPVLLDYIALDVRFRENI